MLQDGIDRWFVATARRSKQLIEAILIAGSCSLVQTEERTEYNIIDVKYNCKWFIDM